MNRKEMREAFLAALTGAGQGAAMDLGDEAYGVARGGIDKLMGGGSFKDNYEKRRDEARSFIKSEAEHNPVAYGAGDLAGSMVSFPGGGPANTLGRPILERTLRSGIEGAIGGFGRSEGESAKDIAADTAAGAASSAGQTMFFDQLLSKMGDVIDFKKMKKKKAAEKIVNEIDEGPAPGKYSGNLGKTNKERMAENNARAMREADIRPKKDYTFPDEEIRPRPEADRHERVKESLSKIQQLMDAESRKTKGGNVRNITGDFEGKTPRMAPTKDEQYLEEVRRIRDSSMHREDKESAFQDLAEKYGKNKPDTDYTPEHVWERINARMGDDTEKSTIELKRLMQNVEKKGADEPYVGRDYAGVAALENPKNRKYPQPLPVPPSKIGDLKGVLGKGVLKGDSDPFGWMDAKYGVSKALLERETNKPLKIYTRSDLIAHDDYLEHINPKLHEVNIVISSPADRLMRVAEPGAPSLKRRITAANRLAEHGIKVNFIYQTYDNPKLTDKFREVVQPPLMETMRSLKEAGLAPGIKVIEQRTPIADGNVKSLKKIFGDEYGS